MTYTGQQPAQTPKKAVPFTGRISQDIVVNTTQSGLKVTNISIAIDQISGETQWAQATFWGSDAQIASDFLKKGDTLNATGLMYMKSFQRQDGTPGSSLQFDSCSLLLGASKVSELIVRIVDSKIANLAPQAAPQGATQMVEQAIAQPNVVQTQATPPAPVAPVEEPILSINSDDLPF